jgi:glutamate synthase domain-containing protein 3
MMPTPALPAKTRLHRTTCKKRVVKKPHNEEEDRSRTRESGEQNNRATHQEEIKLIYPQKNKQRLAGANLCHLIQVKFSSVFYTATRKP